MRTIPGSGRDLGAARQDGIEVHIPSHPPAYDSSQDDAAKRRPAALEGPMERQPLARRAAAWAAGAARNLLRLFRAYLPGSADPVPGWDPTIKWWNTLGTPYDKARPPNPKQEAHHSHGSQTDF